MTVQHSQVVTTNGNGNGQSQFEQETYQRPEIRKNMRL